MTQASSSSPSAAPSGTKSSKRKSARAGAAGSHPDKVVESKCYQVSDKWEGRSIIAWCKSSAEARRRGMGEFGVEFGEVRTKRLPGLDRFDGDVEEWKFENGWWSTCHYHRCWRECTKDDGAVYQDGLWCCCPEHLALEKSRRSDEQKQKAAATAEALRLKPGSIVHDVHINPDGTPILHMTFPSGTERWHTLLDWLASEEGQQA